MLNKISAHSWPDNVRGLTHFLDDLVYRLITKNGSLGKISNSLFTPVWEDYLRGAKSGKTGGGSGFEEVFSIEGLTYDDACKHTLVGWMEWIVQNNTSEAGRWTYQKMAGIIRLADTTLRKKIDEIIADGGELFERLRHLEQEHFGPKSRKTTSLKKSS